MRAVVIYIYLLHHIFFGSGHELALCACVYISSAIANKIKWFHQKCKQMWMKLKKERIFVDGELEMEL